MIYVLANILQPSIYFSYKIVFAGEDVNEETYKLIDTFEIHVPIKYYDINTFSKKMYNDLISMIPTNMIISYETDRGILNSIYITYLRVDLTLNYVELYKIYLKPHVQRLLMDDFVVPSLRHLALQRVGSLHYSNNEFERNSDLALPPDSLRDVKEYRRGTLFDYDVYDL